jgi:hypothetical protein
MPCALRHRARITGVASRKGTGPVTLEGSVLRRVACLELDVSSLRVASVER